MSQRTIISCLDGRWHKLCFILLERASLVYQLPIGSYVGTMFLDTSRYISLICIYLSLSTSNPVWFGSRMMPCDSLAISLPEP